MENKKLSEEELQTINELRTDFANAFANIGSVQSRIKELEEENESNYATLKEIQKKEADLFEKLKTAYGEGTVDLITGEFKPVQ
jgi:predicted transcriptional regulator